MTPSSNAPLVKIMEQSRSEDSSSRPLRTEQDTLSESFTYEPFDLDTDTIRLLQPIGFDDDGRVLCSLRNVARSQAKYFAVSYTWELESDSPESATVPRSRASKLSSRMTKSASEAQPTLDTISLQTININGKALVVHQNIYNFLLQLIRALRTLGILPHSDSQEGNQSFNVRYFHTYDFDRQCDEEVGYTRLRDSMQGIDGWWIDAICLDQKNLRERNHQVQQMYDIYASAATVTVWLGRAMGPIESWLSRFEELSSRPFDRSQVVRLAEAWCQLALFDLLNLQYWSRAWVVQELLAAKQILIFYGRFVLPWFTLWYNNLVVVVKSKLTSTAAYKHYRPTGQILKHLDLEAALVKYHKLGCKDPRDRIYSLQAIIKSAEQFDVDYAESVEGLAIRAAMFFEGSIGRFDTLLRALGLAHDHKSSLSLTPNCKIPPDYSSEQEESWSITTELLSEREARFHDRPLVRLDALSKACCPICGDDRGSIWRMLNYKKSKGCFIDILCTSAHRESTHFIRLREAKAAIWLGPIDRYNDVDAYYAVLSWNLRVSSPLSD